MSLQEVKPIRSGKLRKKKKDEVIGNAKPSNGDLGSSSNGGVDPSSGKPPPSPYSTGVQSVLDSGSGIDSDPLGKQKRAKTVTANFANYPVVPDPSVVTGAKKAGAGTGTPPAEDPPAAETYPAVDPSVSPYTPGVQAALASGQPDETATGKTQTGTPDDDDGGEEATPEEDEGEEEEEVFLEEGQRPADTLESDKAFGRDPRTGVEKRLGEMATTLGFDVEGERASRTAEIDRLSEESRQRVSRIFSLDPSGIQQGRAVRAFSEIEGERNRALAEMETDLSRRTADERRKNIATLRGVQESREALTSRERGQEEVERAALAKEGLSDRQIDEVIRSTKEQEKLKGRALSETERAALISEAQAGRVQTEVERSNQVTEALQGVALTEDNRAALAKEGLSDRQIDEVIRSSKRQEDLQGRQLTEAERAAVIAEAMRERVQAEIERANQVAEGLRGVELIEDNREALAREGLSQQQIDEVIASNQAQENLKGRALSETERAALIEETFKSRVQTEVERFNKATQTHRQRVDLAGLVGTIDGKATLDKEAQLLRERGQTEAERQNKVAERLKEAGLTGLLPGDELSTNEITKQLGLSGTTWPEKVREAKKEGFTFDSETNSWWKQPQLTLSGQDAEFSRALQQGNLTGDYRDPETGQWFTTMAAKELSLREGQLKTENELESDMRRGALLLQGEAQRHGQSVTEAQLTGVFVKSGMDISELHGFADAFGASSVDDADTVDEETGEITEKGRYDEKWDFNEDGVIDFADFNELSAVASGGVSTTLNGQRFAEDKSNNDFRKELEKARVTGQFDDEETIQEAQRRFNNKIKDAETFMSPPPLTFTIGSFFTLSSKETKRSDPSFRTEFDLNGDSIIDAKDYSMMIAAGKDGRMEILSGDGTGIDDVILFTPPGKQSVIARKFGLEEKKFTETIRRHEAEFDENRRTWDSEFSGVLFDDDGNARQKEETVWSPQYNTYVKTGKMVDLTSVERDTLESKKIQFNKKLQQDFTLIFKELGISEEKWKAELAAKVGSERFSQVKDLLNMVGSVYTYAAAKTGKPTTDTEDEEGKGKGKVGKAVRVVGGKIVREGIDAALSFLPGGGTAKRAIGKVSKWLFG